MGAGRSRAGVEVAVVVTVVVVVVVVVVVGVSMGSSAKREIRTISSYTSLSMPELLAIMAF